MTVRHSALICAILVSISSTTQPVMPAAFAAAVPYLKLAAVFAGNFGFQVGCVYAANRTAESIDKKVRPEKYAHEGEAPTIIVVQISKEQAKELLASDPNGTKKLKDALEASQEPKKLVQQGS